VIALRYVDTGSRDQDQALAAWFEAVLRPDAEELRWQSGFFFADGAAPLVATLERFRGSDRLVHGVIGANIGTTLRADVQWLARTIGVPRQNAYLGLVGFAGGLYHPKCYHVTRDDGSQCAYVGSGNLTAPGVSGLNIEAGVLLDTRDGDSEEVLGAIAAGVDRWFHETPEGLHLIDTDESIAAAIDLGLLVEALPPRPELPAEVADENTPGPDTGNRQSGRPRLRPLIGIQRVHELAPVWEARPLIRPPVAYAPVAVVPRTGYPDNFFFAPNAAVATRDGDALSGATLPGGAVGIVVRLNKDSARHFQGGTGTANMSIPLATAHTLRFGSFQGRYARPRAQFDLRVRYIASARQVMGKILNTNVMPYGYEAGEPGNKDLRLLIPAGVSALGEEVRALGYLPPAVDDVAFLEWPTQASSDFRLTYLERNSELAVIAQNLLAEAERTGKLAGRGAAWLPADISPVWA
jgi:hypothetical protein